MSRNMIKLEELEQRVQYCFQDKEKLKRALIHSSYANEKKMKKFECNERLEFLGDAVLEVLSSEHLFFAYPIKTEGELTKMRSERVCESALAYCAKKIGLGDFLLLGKGEEMTGGRNRDSIISDGMEALIGAIYLDGGLKPAGLFVEKFILMETENMALAQDNKTLLQELVQRRTQEPVSYHMIHEEGPDHNKMFTVEVRVGDVKQGEGRGKTKKAAEQAAAFEGIKKLQDR